MKKYYVIAALSGLLIIAGTASAEEEEGFSGRVGLGYIATSGNSESKSANGNFDLLWNYEPWRHSLSGLAIKSSTSGAVSYTHLTLPTTLNSCGSRGGADR